MLHQSFLHCAIFPTAASRRSLGRISVPMWPFNLSVRLLIVALVSRYLTNKLIRREPISKRIAPLMYKSCGSYILCGISSRFQLLSPSLRQIAHALLTSPPLSSYRFDRSLRVMILVRLACVRHAASVHPEPGSNSLKNLYLFLISFFELCSKQSFFCFSASGSGALPNRMLGVLLSLRCLIYKVQALFRPLTPASASFATEY